jgi:hypothetical protein
MLTSFLAWLLLAQSIKRLLSIKLYLRRKRKACEGYRNLLIFKLGLIAKREDLILVGLQSMGTGSILSKIRGVFNEDL